MLNCSLAPTLERESFHTLGLPFAIRLDDKRVQGTIQVENPAQAIYVKVCGTCQRNSFDHSVGDSSADKAFCIPCGVVRLLVKVIEVDCLITSNEGVEITVKADGRCVKQLFQKTKEELLQLKGIPLQLFLNSVKLQATFHLNFGHLMKIVLPTSKQDSPMRNSTAIIPITPEKPTKRERATVGATDEDDNRKQKQKMAVFYAGVNAGSDGPYLRPEIPALRDLHLVGAQENLPKKPEEPGVVSEPAEPSVPRQKANRSTGGKPK
ncbi:hypothetical protein R1sor_026621 [Riccia sorocarpa]|uniref:Uncharacterized protein n=1 Tax=Riccia sorocarpa TaxID=122646 RepID=A0ABD3GCK4_9MARC